MGRIWKSAQRGSRQGAGSTPTRSEWFRADGDLEQGIGPGTVTFADPKALITTATFSAPGTYVLKLTADNGERPQLRPP